jgi:hypothetical protein
MKRIRVRKPERPAVAARPAETATGVAGAIAVLVAAVFKLTDPQVLLALPVVIAAIPALVSTLVDWKREGGA